MKKVLLFLLMLGAIFTLSACEDTTGIIDDISNLDTNVTETIADIDALETEVAALEAELESLDSQVRALNKMGAEVDELEVQIHNIKNTLTLILGRTTELEQLTEELEDTYLAVEELRADVDELLLTYDLVDTWDEMVNTEIVIMYNNDVHGRVNDDSWAGSIGFATIKNMVDAIRESYDNTFFVNAGDMFHGTTFATLEQGESVVEVMNAVGYDLMVPGNHDFDYGQDQLLVLEGLADFPLISANIQYAADDTDMFDPYYVVTFGDVKVGFFGITTPDTTYMTHPDNVTGLIFLDPVTQAQAMVDMLTADADDDGEECDIVIMLGHVGLDDSSSVTSADIANAVDGIDIIIDGHSHSFLPQGEMVNGTLIVSAKEYNKNFGVLRFTVEDGMIVEYNNLLINTDEADVIGLGADEDVQAIIDDIEEDQAVILDEVVGQTADELDGVRDNVRTGETNLGRLITDSMIEVTGADIAITNGGGIRDSIAAGDVTKGDIITVLPFGNIIVTVELTGQEIIDTLEYGTSSAPTSSGKFPHVAGLTYDLDLNAAEGSRVINVEVGGVAIDPLATYTVATNDFMAAGGDGYTILGNADITGEFMGLHEALESMFTVDVDVIIPADVRLTIIPVAS